MSQDWIKMRKMQKHISLLADVCAKTVQKQIFFDFLVDAVGGFGNVLRAILAVLGALGDVLGTSWKFFEASWRRS